MESHVDVDVGESVYHAEKFLDAVIKATVELYFRLWSIHHESLLNLAPRMFELTTEDWRVGAV